MTSKRSDRHLDRRQVLRSMCIGRVAASLLSIGAMFSAGAAEMTERAFIRHVGSLMDQHVSRLPSIWGQPTIERNFWDNHLRYIYFPQDLAGSDPREASQGTCQVRFLVRPSGRIGGFDFVGDACRFEDAQPTTNAPTPRALVREHVVAGITPPAFYFGITEVDGILVTQRHLETPLFWSASTNFRRATPMGVHLPIRRSRVTITVLSLPEFKSFGRTSQKKDVKRFDGSLNFTPRPEATYAVTGWIDGDRAAAWIEDVESGEPVTETLEWTR